jgi:hypothetical protein
MSDARGLGNESLASISEADLSEILSHVDEEIVDRFDEFNANLEKSLDAVSRELDARNARARPSQAIKDRIIGCERNTIRLRQHTLLSDMKKFYRNRRKCLTARQSASSSMLNGSLMSISETGSCMDGLEEVESEVAELREKRKRLEVELQKLAGAPWADDLLQQLSGMTEDLDQVFETSSLKTARLQIDAIKNKLSNISSQKVLNTNLRSSNRVANRLTGIEKYWDKHKHTPVKLRMPPLRAGSSKSRRRTMPKLNLSLLNSPTSALDTSASDRFGN